jgi:3-oxoacyl-(acyl-carrier-protein) synthase
VRRAFVQGIGAVSPFGASWLLTKEALAAGRTAVAEIRHFDVTGFPCTAAASIEGADGSDRRLDFALPAAREAFEAAGRPRGVLGVFIGAESGRPRWPALLGLVRGAARPDPREVSPAAVAAEIARAFRAEGPVETLSLACASGAAAIAEGLRALRRGECDHAVCGGVGADVDPLTLAGFGLLGALSAKGVSRPFDAHRDGFVIGEGAAMVVLSREEGPIELAGGGRSLDAYQLTAPDPKGRGAVRAMRAALADAGETAADVIQAHGTSTPLNDAIEAAALREVLGERLSAAHVSSVKGALGHGIAAAGAFGFVSAAEALASGVVFPTAGLSTPDSECALPHVTGRALRRQSRVALVNSFAFGGANVSLVLRRAA